MCGIAGILSFNKSINFNTVKFVNKMANSLQHRGPDAEGFWSDSNIALGHRRLSIFDLSENGNQPMVTSNGRYIITYNGEVYNWPEIRKSLKFDDWKSNTDTETILYAFQEKKYNFLNDLNGIFVITIWDREKEELFLARDRIGVKPLYYTKENNQFYFASEPKALFAGGVEKKPNYHAIYDFLRWGLIDHDDKSFFDGIISLLPGEAMIVKSNGNIRKFLYWNLHTEVANKSLISEEESVEEYASLLDDSISLQVRSDVEIGSLLSGGIDSSVLTAHIKQNLGERKPSTFTYDFNVKEGIEGAYAKEVADYLDVPSHIVSLKWQDIPEYFPKVLRMQEAPITAFRLLAHHKAYEECYKQNITVLLEGQGGDELGAGYEYYYAPYVLDSLKKVESRDFVQTLNLFMDRFNIKEENRLERFLDCLQTTYRTGVSTQDGVCFVNPALLDDNFLNNFDNGFNGYQHQFDSALTSVQLIDFKHVVLPRAMRFLDRLSMASSREARVPILDHRIVEFSFRTEIEARIKNGFQRNFMRQAAANILPKTVTERPKRTIVDPQRQWLQKELRPWVLEIFNDSIVKDSGIFKQKAIISEYDKYCNTHNPRSSFHIFQYINVIVWLKELFGK